MTDKERFEELAYNVGISLDGEKAMMSSDDYDFLYNYALEQAERVQELENHIDHLYDNNVHLKGDYRLQEQNKRYREALEKIKLNIKICGNEEYFPKVVEEIVNEALEGEE